MRIIVYVDGFNLYYRMLRHNTGTKWLNLHALAEALFPGDTIEAVKYYTARIKALADPDAPQRQLIYLRALATIPNLDVHYGYFQLMKSRRWLAEPVDGLGNTVRVVLPEEKGSDVNLATHLVADGFLGKYDRAVVISNDADFKEPVRLVVHDIGLPVTVVYPTDHPAGEIRKAEPTELLKLSVSTVRKSQFPDTLADEEGEFREPAEW